MSNIDFVKFAEMMAEGMPQLARMINTIREGVLALKGRIQILETERTELLNRVKREEAIRKERDAAVELMRECLRMHVNVMDSDLSMRVSNFLMEHRLKQNGGEDVRTS